MRAIKAFDEFLKDGTVKRQKPDKSRAEFLIKEAEQDYSFLLKLIKRIGINDENANSIVKLCYDIIMELIRAKMLLDGFKASGVGAHEAEISYLRNLGFNEKDIQLADQLRYIRNGMLYYGTIIDKESAESTFNFLKNIYPKLKKLVSLETR
jgi:hypothetical protein